MRTCVGLCLHSKRKMVQAINTNLGRHTVNDSCSACIDILRSKVKSQRSMVKVSRLSNALTTWVCMTIALFQFSGYYWHVVGQQTLQFHILYTYQSHNICIPETFNRSSNYTDTCITVCCLLSSFSNSERNTKGQIKSPCLLPTCVVNNSSNLSPFTAS